MQTLPPSGIDLCPQGHQREKLFHEPKQEGRKATMEHKETQRAKYINQRQQMTAHGID